MSMPIEWEYMEKDSNILAGKTMTSIANGVGGLAGGLTGGSIIEKAKQRTTGGYNNPQQQQQ